MAKTLNALSPRGALVEIARVFYQRGWMYGTAGNLSTRIALAGSEGRGEIDSFWITASGLPKGHLEEGDFVRVAVESGELIEPRANAKPSAETQIHRVIYRRLPRACACLHVHSITSVLATEKHAPHGASAVPLPSLEMLKGLDIWDENPQVILPVFENHADVAKIADEIDGYLAETPQPPVPGVMIRGHGITVWGENPQQAFNRTEVMEFILAYLAQR